VKCIKALPPSNIHEALGWIDVCYFFMRPEEMKMDGDAQKPSRYTEWLTLDFNISVASKTSYCFSFVKFPDYL
jgi:hypothetical protein